MTDASATLSGRTRNIRSSIATAPAGSISQHATAFAGQLAAGIGNFGFALAAGRLLSPGEFAAVAAFLAIYLLVHVPSASLGASAALDPARLADATRTLTTVGVGLGLLTALAASPLASALNLSVPMVLALAAAMPAAGVLGVRRGVLYGTGRTTQVAASLAGEPAVRLGLGLPLMLAFGPGGAAFAVAVGGWIGLLIATRPWPAHLGAGSPTTATAPTSTPAQSDGVGVTTAAGTAGFTAATFLAFALIANQDLLVANSVLSPNDAGGFAVLSVLGSAVAFATATIPMVLLPAAASKTSPHATRVALTVTAALGGVAVLVGALVPRFIIGTVFGSELTHVAPLLAPYLAAMALLAVGRVLAAHHCADGRSRVVAVIIGAGVAVHLTVLVTITRTPGSIVAATVAATAATCLALVAAPTIDRRLRPVPTTADSADQDVMEPIISWFRRPDVTWVSVAILVAIAVRLVMTRGLWVDEAISVAQAQLSFGDMLEQLRWTDVHPPLHHAILWVTVRIAGTSELVVRMPSILAGAALVPVIYLLGRDLYDRSTARIAALAIAFAPFLVWYSQEARMYAVFMLAATAAVLGQVRVLRTNSLADWTLYTVATVAMAWSQYFAALPIAVQQVAFLIVLWQRRGQRSELRPFAMAWAGSLLALLLLVAPMAPIAIEQFTNYTDRRQDIEGITIAPAEHGPVGTAAGQQELSIYAVLANGLWSVWGYHSDRTMLQVAAFWPLGMLVALLLLGRGRSRDTTLLIALTVLPAAALFAAAFYKRDLFELRYFCGAVPLAILLISRAATRFGSTRITRTALGTVLLFTLAVGLVDQQLNGTNPRRYDFDGAISAVSATWQPGDVLLYEPTYLSEVVEYYGPGLAMAPIDRADSPVVAGAPTVYVLATDRVINETETAARVGGVLAALESEGRVVVARIERANVTVWELR